MKESSQNYLKVAKKAALEAGSLLLRSYGKLKNSQIHTKSKNDFVTELDKKSEKLIISIIRRSFPGHSIQGEEGGLAKGSPVLWIIDPLDGTTNYIHQFPMFSVSIGISVNGVLEAGVVYDPLHQELFFARKGAGAFLNKKKIRVSAVNRLADALMTTGIPFKGRYRFDEYMSSFRQISLGSSGMRRGGSAALDLAYVACGRLDGFWEINLSAWDIAAGALLVKEAGGRISDLWGKAGYLQNGDVLASNRRIHAQIQAITSAALSPKKPSRKP